MIDGVDYAIDVTQPARYDESGALVAPEARRIRDLTFNGAPVDPNQPFLVVTNNYRASGGGGFPGCDGTSVVIEAPDANRDVAAQIRREQNRNRAEVERRLALRALAKRRGRDLSDIARGVGASGAARPEADLDGPRARRLLEAARRDGVNAKILQTAQNSVAVIGLIFARALEPPHHNVVLTAFLAQGLDFLGEIFKPRVIPRLFRCVALVKPL